MSSMFSNYLKDSNKFFFPPVVVVYTDGTEIMLMDQGGYIVTHEEWKELKRKIDLFYDNQTPEQVISMENNISKRNKEISKTNILIKNENKQGYVYIIKGENNTYKIGITKDINKRKSVFDIKLPFTTELIYSFKSNNMLKDEQFFHNKFKNKRLNGEWFKLDNKDLDCIKKYGDSNANKTPNKRNLLDPVENILDWFRPDFPEINQLAEDEYAQLYGIVRKAHQVLSSEKIRLAWDNIRSSPWHTDNAPQTQSPFYLFDFEGDGKKATARILKYANNSSLKKITEEQKHWDAFTTKCEMKKAERNANNNLKIDKAAEEQKRWEELTAEYEKEKAERNAKRRIRESV